MSSEHSDKILAQSNHENTLIRADDQNRIKIQKPFFFLLLHSLPFSFLSLLFVSTSFFFFFFGSSPFLLFFLFFSLYFSWFAFFSFFILHSPLFLASFLIKYHPLPLRHGEVGVWGTLCPPLFFIFFIFIFYFLFF